MEAGEPAAAEEHAREVERAPLGLAPAHGDHGSSCVERVQPLGRGGHAGPHDLHGVVELVRLVRVHRAGVALEPLGPGEARVARREQDVREDAVPVDLEPALDRPHALDARGLEALVPAGGGTQLVDVVEELRDGRVVAVEERLDERRRAPAADRRADGEPGKGAGRAVPVALGAHPPLADGRGAHPPHGRRVRVRRRTRRFRPVRAPFPEGGMGTQAGEAAADDCARPRHGYLTDPARRPWTK